MKDRFFWKNFIEKISKKFTHLDFEMVALENKTGLTRFAESTIHQNVEESDLELSFKAINGNRMGVVKINSLDDNVLLGSINKAIELSKIMPELDYPYHCVEPQNYYPVNSFFKDTAQLSPMDRSRIIGKMVKKINQMDYDASGALENGMETMVVANSDGVFAFHDKTKVDFNCVINKGNSSAYRSLISNDINQLDFEKITEELIDTARMNVDQMEIEPGTYTAILSPDAVAEVLSESDYAGFDGKLIEEGKSFIAGKQGKKLFPESITIFDDPFHPMTMSIPFDFAGYPRQKHSLIKNGIIIGGVYDHFTALKHQKKCTGNTLSPVNASIGAISFNLVMQQGEDSLEELLKSTKYGIYISRFHYVNLLDPMSIELTGMTKDGTFLIENGKLTRAIKNMRFNISIIELLQGVDMISSERHVKPGFVGPVVAPYLRTNHFTFSSKTTF